jgi:predicted DsbA family dithiol-disulfide isomerase
VVDLLKANQEIEVEWLPFYLNPNTPPEGADLPAYVRSKAKELNGRLQQMAQGYGMAMTPLERMLNTRRAHEATEYARAHGKGNEFHRIVFRKVYADGQDISHWEPLRAAAEEAGLNADEMQAEVEQGKYTAVVQGLVDEAHAIGVTGVPTYVLNDRYAVVGAQPYSVFEQVIAKLGEEDEGEEDE